jgi:hypothetical protein
VSGFQTLGRLLLILGGVFVALGFLLTFAGKSGWLTWLGRLPGDIHIRRGNFSVYVPLTTSLILSVLLTLVLSLLFRRR